MTMKTLLQITGCVVSLMLCSTFNSGFAATVNWDGSVDATWSQPDATSWTGGTYNVGDDVVFGNTGLGIVTLSGALTPGGLTFQHTAGIYYITNAGSTANNIVATGGLSLSGGGTLQIGNLANSPSTLASLLAWSGATTISSGSSLAVTRPGTLGGAGSLVTLDGGTLRLATDNTADFIIANPFSIASGGGTLRAEYVGNISRFILANNFAGNAALSLVTAGQAGNRTGGFRYSGTNSAYDGAVTLASTGTGGVDGSGMHEFLATNSLFSGASSVIVRDRAIMAFGYSVTDADLAGVTFQTGAGLGTFGGSGTLTNLSAPFSSAARGGIVLLDNRDGLNQNRYADSGAVPLNSQRFWVRGRNANASLLQELVGDITFAGGARLTLERLNGNSSGVKMTAASLNSPSAGNTLLVDANNSSAVYGTNASECHLKVTGVKPAVNNGMISPGIQHYSGANALGHFMTFTNDDLMLASGNYTTDFNSGSSSEIASVGATTLTLTADETAYAIRLGQSITINSGVTLTLTGGGIAMSSVNINGPGFLNLGSGPAFIGTYNAASQGTISARISGSGGLTIFGVGQTLNITSPTNDFTGGIFINGGAVRFQGNTAANSNHVTVNAFGRLVAGNGATNDTVGGLSGAGTVSGWAASGGASTDTINLSPASGTHTFDGQFVNGASGRTLVLRKSGAGTQVFSASSIGSYSGATFVHGGALVVDGNFLAATNTITVASNATLGGSGRVGGAVTVNAGGQLTPGASIGTFSVSNTVTLGGITLMELDRDSGPNADKLVANVINVGGTLIVTNINLPSPIQDNDIFDLFDGVMNGAFASILLPDISGVGLAWNTNSLYVNGTITAVAVFNNPPGATNHFLGTVLNFPKVIPTARLLLGCSDADNDPLTVSAVSPSSTNGGTVVLTTTNVTYTPASNYVGTDAFTFTISDGRGGTAVGTVLVNVTNGQSQNMVSWVHDAGAGTLTVTFAGIPGYTYRVQYATTLSPADWTDLSTNTAPAHGQFQIVDMVGGNTNRFYRTVYP